jgi:NADH-quinone oxidoreductase subunit E
MQNEVKIREKPNMTVIDAMVAKHNVNPGAMIAILQEVQETYGYIPKEAIRRISSDTGVPAADIFGIVTFYAQFRLEPLGEHVIKVCHGTACHLNGAERVAESLCQCVGAKEGENSPDGKFTVEKVACLGCCSLSPTIMIDNEVYGRLTPESVQKVVKDFKETESGSRAPAESK